MLNQDQEDRLRVEADLQRLIEERRAATLARSLQEKAGLEDEPISTPVPEDLFRLGRTDPVVASMLRCWRNGEISWEQMLLWLVLALQQEKERLLGELVKAIERQPPAPILVPTREKA